METSREGIVDGDEYGQGGAECRRAKPRSHGGSGGSACSRTETALAGHQDHEECGVWRIALCLYRADSVHHDSAHPSQDWSGGIWHMGGFPRSEWADISGRFGVGGNAEQICRRVSRAKGFSGLSAPPGFRADLVPPAGLGTEHGCVVCESATCGTALSRQYDSRSGVSFAIALLPNSDRSQYIESTVCFRHHWAAAS